MNMLRRIHQYCAAAGFLLALFLACSSACGQTRTAWQMHQGEGVVIFPVAPQEHGDTNEYQFATIPDALDGGWTAAPDADIIHFDRPSTLCGYDCQTAGDFTYFQTFVHIPANVEVTEFTMSFYGIDDGVRVSLFNSDHPDGVVVEGSYVFLLGTGTANLASLVKGSETNRVVVTHVDDCCSLCFLSRADVVLNGESIAGPPTLRITREANGVEIHWHSRLGKLYQLESCERLDVDGWRDVGSPIEGGDSEISVPDAVQPAASKFYRLRVWPAGG